MRDFGWRLWPSAMLLLVAACGSSDEVGADWPGYGGTADESHFSPLTQINDSNVSRLGLAWSIDLPTTVASHSAPVAVAGILYFSVGYSVISAVDAKTGRTIWQYDPKVADVLGDEQRAAWGARGIAYGDDKIFTGTQDGRLIALDAKTGALVWSVQTREHLADGRYITGAPRFFNGKVIIGHGGADYANIRGYVTTYDADSGRQLWRFYTVPGKPGTKDGAASDSVMPMAARTWSGEWWKYGGGGTAWNAITFDRELNRIYIGTGNGAPWNRNIRSPGGGDNLFLSSIIAVDADSGEYIWHYQTTPGESWDYASTMDIALATLRVAGNTRRVILHAPKNGFFYVIDRDSGKLLSAKPFAKVTWANQIDPGTGRPIENPEARYPNGQTLIWPSPMGAHNWTAASFSPQTRLVYIPKIELPGLYDEKGIESANWRRRERLVFDSGFNPFAGTDVPPTMPGSLGALLAWDPIGQKARWSVPLRDPHNGGIASTAGNLVFQGNAEGRFVAYAADNGKTLWSFDAQNGIIGQPITFLADGRQYVSVMTGFGGIASSLGPMAARSGWDYRTQRRRLLTFAIGGSAKLSPLVRDDQPIADDNDFKIDLAFAQKGARIYGEQCLSCHGVAAVAGGNAPDLRKSAVPLSAETFRAVVGEGVLSPSGMPKFDELKDADLLALRHFIRLRARDDLRAEAPRR
jgi:quinohemoprotein ethanol dehydrogenase